MQPDLQPKDPLSQVVFVHDYVQLVFHDSGYTLYNRATYRNGSLVVQQGEPGFCDALVGLINYPASVECSSTQLELRFVTGASISVPNSGPDARGPEAWMFSQLGGPTVVEQNA